MMALAGNPRVQRVMVIVKAQAIRRQRKAAAVRQPIRIEPAQHHLIQRQVQPEARDGIRVALPLSSQQVSRSRHRDCLRARRAGQSVALWEPVHPGNRFQGWNPNAALAAQVARHGAARLQLHATLGQFGQDQFGQVHRDALCLQVLRGKGHPPLLQRVANAPDVSAVQNDALPRHRLLPKRPFLCQRRGLRARGRDEQRRYPPHPQLPRYVL